MRIPLSWLKEYVDIAIPVELLAERLTLAGLEVGGLTYIGVPQQHVPGVRQPPSDHLVWDREKILLGVIREVRPHPDADRLVLALVDYGTAEPEQCVTGAPNLFQYKGQSSLSLWTAIALEGAEVWDSHSEAPKRMILKGKPLRGIHNKSMVCSEKELGISDEHEGVIIMHEDPGFTPGTPLQDVLGDVIIEIELTPNLARCFSVLGVAREVAALLDQPLKQPDYSVTMTGTPIIGQVAVEIREPALNPRFTLALLRDTEVKPSPEWMQRRLKLVGQRPINNMVDVTNYITFEIGQPLHAFDYDKLAARAPDGAMPKIITRLPEPGETLRTLDEVERTLQDINILVCDEQGVLSLGGVIGGAETEIDADTKNVLLEAANWNFINIRRTMQAQKVITDAGVRFSRGVHPSQAMLGVRRGIALMHQFGGGQVADGIIDEYPQPAPVVTLDLPASEIKRLTGMQISAAEAAAMLRRLLFEVEVNGDTLRVTVPDHRMDIDTGVIGQADLVEEIARVHGYDQIPSTMIADLMPDQWTNVALEREEQARDVLVALGLRENITYRFTTPEREALLIAATAAPESADIIRQGADYVRLANPITPDKTVLRHTLLVNLLDVARANLRYNTAQQLFEIGNVYHDRPGQQLPDEPRRLAIVMSGARQPANWADAPSPEVDYFDLKGIIEGLLTGLHIVNATYEPAAHPSLHPGRSAALRIGEQMIGAFGELHPLVARAFELTAVPVMVAEFDLDALLTHVNPLYAVKPLPLTPAVLEDIALVVPDSVPAAQVEQVIRHAGGQLLKNVTLFDVYRGAPVPEQHKSLAYNLVYQTDDRTLTDQEVASVRKKIVKAAEKQLGATLRA